MTLTTILLIFACIVTHKLYCNRFCTTYLRGHGIAITVETLKEIRVSDRQDRSPMCNVHCDKCDHIVASAYDRVLPHDVECVRKVI
jgi:hypothetical protein